MYKRQVYGISDFTLAKNISVTRAEARDFMERYFARYPGVKRFMDEAVRAGRVVVMDAGRVAMQGTPREVFLQVDRIRALGLDVPEMMQLAAQLRSAGLTALNPSTMTIEEMAEELCRLKSEI